MNNFTRVCVVVLMNLPLALYAAVDNADDPVAAALADPDRLSEHRVRDARSKPEVVLPLLRLKTGDAAADIFGGGGYYSDLMASLVGAEGKVILHNNTPYAAFVGEKNQQRYGDGQRPPVQLLKSEVDDLQLAADSLDAALLVMSYHDLYFHNPERGWGETDVGLFFEQLRAALKPGGRLVIVDHAAADGTGSKAAQDLHRIEEAYAREDVASAGFRFVASNPALLNTDDDHSKMVFDSEVRGKTDRFILVFEKP